MILLNDAGAAALGEFWFGSGRSADIVILWTLGTGVGCGIVINGECRQGKHSHAAECGHVIVQMENGRACPGTGQHGTLEAYVSARSLVLRCKEELDALRCKEELDAGRRSSIRNKLRAGDELTTILIAEAAEDGDELAEQLVIDTACYLAVGTVNVMNTVDPEVVLVGGGMTFG